MRKWFPPDDLCNLRILHNLHILLDKNCYALKIRAYKRSSECHEFFCSKLLTWGQFHQCYMCSFYARRSLKCKNSVKFSVSFYAFGICVGKSCAKNIWWNWHLMWDDVHISLILWQRDPPSNSLNFFWYSHSQSSSSTWSEKAKGLRIETDVIVAS